jgi:hypothetical protein
MGHHSQPKVELLNEVALTVHDDPLRNGRVARDKRERRDGCGVLTVDG